MRVPVKLRQRMAAWAERVRASRAPDFVVEDNYLLRWWVIPRNPLFNIYLHEIRKSDDDRALHDHPWLNCSILLSGFYCEHSIAAGGVHHRKWLFAGAIRLRRARAAHRLEILDGARHPAVTLFITGPHWRQWGFHCPDAGWRHWAEFTSAEDSGKTGRGCA